MMVCDRNFNGRKIYMFTDILTADGYLNILYPTAKNIKS